MFRLKGFMEIDLSRQNKITSLICLINHGIFPPNMKYMPFNQYKFYGEIYKQNSHRRGNILRGILYGTVLFADFILHYKMEQK